MYLHAYLAQTVNTHTAAQSTKHRLESVLAYKYTHAVSYKPDTFNVAATLCIVALKPPLNAVPSSLILCAFHFTSMPSFAGCRLPTIGLCRCWHYRLNALHRSLLLLTPSIIQREFFCPSQNNLFRKIKHNQS